MMFTIIVRNSTFDIVCLSNACIYVELIIYIYMRCGKKLLFDCTIMGSVHYVQLSYLSWQE